MRTPLLRLSLFVLFLVARLGCAFCQAPDAVKIPVTNLPFDKYAGESIVIESSENVYSMAADGTGWRQRTVVVRVQSEAAVKQLGVVSIPFAGSSERVEIEYARVRRRDGSVVETPVGDALEMPEQVTREAPFYSDLKDKQIPIRNLRVGDKLEWRARIVRTRAEAPGQFWGQDTMIDDAVVLSQAVELRVPEGKTVKVWSPGLKAVETVATSAEGRQRVYRWTGSNLKATAGKEAEEEAAAKKKKVWTADQELDAREGRLPGIAWTTFPSWEAVGAWYRGLEAGRMEPGAEVKAKVAEVTAGKASEEEKVRAVYGYVATQIRYIGVAFGVGRYQPHRAVEVLENQYGDCKDKHTLLAAMLGALGLKADAVLIGAGVRFNPEVPSPAAFNHLITHVQVGGRPVWLDATAEVAPYETLMFVIRDHPALVVPEVGVARVEKTPAELPFKPFQKMDAVGALDKEGVSDSKLKLTLRGDDEVAVRAVLRQIAPGQYNEFVQRMSSGMGYGGTTSHAEIGRPEDTADPLTIAYDYHREKAGNDWEHLRTIAQLAPVPLPVLDEKEPPVQSIWLGVPRVERSTSAMKLPEGWSAELPEATHAHSAYANLDMTYRFDKGTLYAERVVEILVSKVPVVEWKSYKKWTDAANLGNEQYVQLKRAGGKAEVAVAPAVKEGASDAEKGEDAAKLVASAYEALQVPDVTTATRMLDEALAKNVSQAGLWEAYGLAAVRRGEMTEAVRDFEKELALHPEEYAVYQQIVALDFQQEKPAEGIAVLRRWVAADPGDFQPTTMLVNALVAENDPKGAVAAGDAGIQGLSAEKRRNEDLRFAMAVAELKAGMKEKGKADLTALLTTTENSGMLNSAAYELAVAGEQLGLAEASTRAALDKMATQSKAWTLDESTQTLRGTSGLIEATWDTMGWILFKEGRSEEAEGYLRAAWQNTQRVEVGEHLGDLLARKGDKAGAMKIYEMAMSTIPTFDMLGRRKEKESPDAVRIRGKIVALGGKGPKAGDVREAEAVQAIRTIPLGSAGGRNGRAEYKMLLSSAGVERVLRTGDKDLAGGEGMVKGAKLAGFFPAGAEERLVRFGFLNCHSGGCDLVLEP